MTNRVAIVAVGEIGQDDTLNKNLEEISYEVVKDLLNQVGMKREELGTIITSSPDFWQGISCSPKSAIKMLPLAMKSCFFNIRLRME